ncbi:transcriptional repressor [Candidatus Aerophobetes bacterium]|nr:transcriptional repressor [Candidatus Aerophobetes bacterium]
MITNLEKIKNCLKEKGIKPTYQRLKILNYLKESREHPNIEMIYKDLVKEIPTISKTTIYNTLHLFVEKELVLTLSILEFEKKFDGDTSFHQHFLCERCGRIIDLNCEASCTYPKIKQIDGHKVKGMCSYFKGICKDCLDSVGNT